MHFNYFFKYIFGKRNRQKLLILALSGLLLSSFALIVLLGMMGGLQSNVIERSKNVLGTNVIFINQDQKFSNVINYLNSKKTNFITEYEIEILLRYRDTITPAIIHGVDRDLPFFNSRKNLILPLHLAKILRTNIDDQIEIISPSHTTSLLGDVPRMISKRLGEIITTNVTEVDQFHGFIDIKSIQNLIRSLDINRIRIYGNFEFNEFKSKFPKINIFSWEELNAELNWSLLFEKRLMTTIFALMCILISISIVSGLFIFFDRIKKDFVSFWILGLSKKNLEQKIIIFIQALNILAILLGTFLGLLFLYILDNSNIELLPAIFLDRKIPIKTTSFSIFLAIFIPYFLSTSFTIPALNNLKKRSNYLEMLKSFNN